jgi:two-component system, OmpR family, response regulator
MTDTPRPAPKCVLVVEDDDGSRAAMARTLMKAGFQVVIAATGAAALLAGRELRLDAAIIDVFLPDAGGLGIARGLREALGAVPVLFVTGLAIPAVRKALAPAPVLFKPFTRKKLLTALRRIADLD